MSSSPPTTTTSTTTTTAADHQTYWCHECDMGVLLHPLSGSSDTTTSMFPPLCPHCRHDFLELMDSFPPPLPNSTNSFPNPTDPFFHPFSPLDSASALPLPSTARGDDNFLLDSPYLHRLIHHMMSTNNPPRTNPTPPHYNSPASKSAIESLDRVTIDLEVLQKDPSIVCPVCKDQFVMDSEAKMLPCKHMYHSDCIVPWLEMNNSCPVCRYRLQTHDETEIEVEGMDNFIGPTRLDELLDDDEDLFGFRDTLRNVVRRHQFNNSVDNDSYEQDGGRRAVAYNEFLFSPTQIAEAGDGASDGVGRIGNHVERADSMETVSSWPRWPMEGGGSGSVSGEGEIGVGVGASTRGGDLDTAKS